MSHPLRLARFYRGLGLFGGPAKTPPFCHGVSSFSLAKKHEIAPVTSSRNFSSFCSRSSGVSLGNLYLHGARRTYLHFVRSSPDDYELPLDTLPPNVDQWMKKDPKSMDFFENYWYWRIRGESTLMDTENLTKKSYAQLARDLGLQIVKEESEHMVGLLELYEYLKSSPFIGPFGTIEKPVLVPSVHIERVVGCTGGTGDNEHVPLWFRCKEGFLYRCGECDQIFMLVRVTYSLPDGKDPFPVDPELDDLFDMKLLERGQVMFNSGEYVHWPIGDVVYKQLFKKGQLENKLSSERDTIEKSSTTNIAKSKPSDSPTDKKR